MAAKTRKPLFQRLRAGLQEGIAHTRGDISLKTVEIPEEPPEIDAVTLAGLREQAQMSQAVFAKVLNVSPKTVQSWEQGIRIPSMASRRLIQVFSERPDVICEIVGLHPVRTVRIRIIKTGEGKRRIVLVSSKKEGIKKSS